MQIISVPARQTRSHLPGFGQEINKPFTPTKHPGESQKKNKKLFGQWYFRCKRDHHDRNISSLAGENVKVVRLALQVLDLVTLNIKHDSVPRFMSTYVGPDISGILSSTHLASVAALSQQNLTAEWSWTKQPGFVVLTVCKTTEGSQNQLAEQHNINSL